MLCTINLCTTPFNSYRLKGPTSRYRHQIIYQGFIIPCWSEHSPRQNTPARDLHATIESCKYAFVIVAECSLASSVYMPSCLGVKEFMVTFQRIL